MSMNEGLQRVGESLAGGPHDVEPVSDDVPVETTEESQEETIEHFRLFRKIIKLKRINQNGGMLNGRELTVEELTKYEDSALEAAEELVDNDYLPEERMTTILCEAAGIEDEEEQTLPQEVFTVEELNQHYQNVMRFRDIRLLRETYPGQEDYPTKQAQAIKSATAMIEDGFLPAEIVTAFLEEAMRLRKELV